MDQREVWKWTNRRKGCLNMQILSLIPSSVSASDIQFRSEQLPPGWLDAETEVKWRGIRFHGHRSDSYYNDLVTDIAVLQAGMNAEEEGFDAVCVDSVSDSALYALRSRLRIPVVGPGLTAFHLASMLGNRFSIIVTWERWQHFYRSNLARYEMGHKLASIRATGDHPADDPFSDANRPSTLERILSAARSAVEEDGAEVIVLGSTTMHWATGSLQQDLQVPVISPGMWACKLAETLVKAGLSHSERAFAAPEEHVDAVIRNLGAD